MTPPEHAATPISVSVTGEVKGTGLTPVPPTGQVVRPVVKDRLAWLVAWRGVEGREFDPPFRSPVDGVVDLVVFVDAETGEILRNVFLSGAATPVIVTTRRE
jgi:hypothetical protein